MTGDEPTISASQAAAGRGRRGPIAVGALPSDVDVDDPGWTGVGAICAWI
jgi:hypothetical protein